MGSGMRVARVLRVSQRGNFNVEQGGDSIVVTASRGSGLQLNRRDQDGGRSGSLYAMLPTKCFTFFCVLRPRLDVFPSQSFKSLLRVLHFAMRSLAMLILASNFALTATSRCNVLSFKFHTYFQPHFFLNLLYFPLSLFSLTPLSSLYPPLLLYINSHT
jgi:hypothetical protein